MLLLENGAFSFTGLQRASNLMWKSQPRCSSVIEYRSHAGRRSFLSMFFGVRLHLGRLCVCKRVATAITTIATITTLSSTTTTSSFIKTTVTTTISTTTFQGVEKAVEEDSNLGSRAHCDKLVHIFLGRHDLKSAQGARRVPQGSQECRKTVPHGNKNPHVRPYMSP